MKIANALNAKVSNPTIVYVDGNPEIGSDTLGNGSVLKPWATVSYALSQLPASATDFYTIMVAGIVNDPTQIKLKPNVNIRGYTQGSTITSPLPIILDISFNSILDQGPYLENLQITHDLNYDASFVTSPSSPYFQLNNVAVYGNFTVRGSAANNVVPYFFSYYSYFSGTTQIINSTHTSISDFYNNLTINDTELQYSDSSISSLTCGSSYLRNVMSIKINGSVIENIVLAAPLSLLFTPTFRITNSDIRGTRILDGGKMILNTDVDSWVDYTLTNGAQIQLLSDAKGLKETYSPTDYTPTTQTVDGHFRGVNASLALKANTASLSTVAFSGLYSDLSSKPIFAAGNGLAVSSLSGTITYQIDSSVTQQGNTFNGVSQLVKTDVAGKIPLSVLPTGSTVYQGTWNASTNAPTLSNSSIEASGHFYIVSVAGTVNFGAGNISFDIGDWVISNGTVWGKVDNSDAVTSVNGAQGAISLGFHNLDDTQVTSPVNNSVMIYDNALTKWKNITLSQLQSTLNTASFAANQVLLGAAGGVIQGSSALTFSAGTMNLTGQIIATGNLVSGSGVNAVNGNFSGTVSAILLSGNIDINNVSTNAIQASAVTNAKLANMVANTIKANLTGGTAAPTDATIAQLQVALNTNNFAANQVLFGGAGGAIQGNSGLTYNGTTLAIFGGTSAVVLTGTNPTINFGANSINIAHASAPSAFFTNSINGDLCIRQANTSNKILIGVTGGISQLTITNTLAAFNVGMTLPTTGGVAGTLDYYEKNTADILSMSGPWVAQNWTVTYSRVGNIVVASFPDLYAAVTTPGGNISAAGAIPAKFRPATAKTFEVTVVDGVSFGSLGAGRLVIDNAGVITIYPVAGGTFSAANAGIVATPLSWLV
jgi:hypothetical protein